MSSPLIYSFTEPIRPEALQRLFEQTTWAQGRDLLKIQQMLDNTHLTLGVWDDDKLIAFARAICDDVYRALIEDVVVDSRYRQQGIGSHMIVKLLKRLEHVERVALDCDPKLVTFYEKQGFKLKPSSSMQIIQST